MKFEDIQKDYCKHLFRLFALLKFIFVHKKIAIEAMIFFTIAVIKQF